MIFIHITQRFPNEDYLLQYGQNLSRIPWQAGYLHPATAKRKLVGRR
jgi:hypothetical protein